MRLHCNLCGCIVSTEVPINTVNRGWIECPECIKKAVAEEASLISTITARNATINFWKAKCLEYLVEINKANKGCRRLSKRYNRLKELVKRHNCKKYLEATEITLFTKEAEITKDSLSDNEWDLLFSLINESANTCYPAQEILEEIQRLEVKLTKIMKGVK